MNIRRWATGLTVNAVRTLLNKIGNSLQPLGAERTPTLWSFVPSGFYNVASTLHPEL